MENTKGWHHIKTYEDFICAIKLFVDNGSVYLTSISRNAEVICVNDFELLKYFKKEKKKLLKKNAHISFIKIKIIDCKDVNPIYDYIAEIASEDYNAILWQGKSFIFDKFSNFEKTNFIQDVYNEIEVSILLAFYNAKIKEFENPGEPITDIKPFRTYKAFTLFESYMANRIDKNDLYREISLMYQMLVEYELIERVYHKDFINWLEEKRYIDENTAEDFRCNKNNKFLNIGKSKGKGRLNKFETHFESIKPIPKKGKKQT